MDRRAIVSYDDISSTPQPNGPTQSGSRPPPKKKQRKRNNNNNGHNVNNYAGPSYGNYNSSHNRHQPYSRPQAPPPAEVEEWGNEDTSMSINLGEETWDDSALVDAWDLATQEYEAIHGLGKNWKNQPVEKLGPVSMPEEQEPERADEEQTAFELETQAPDPSTYTLTSTSGLGSITQDEAAARAISAMYAVGYWTAMYQAASAQPTTSASESQTNDPTLPIESTEVHDHDSDASSVGEEEGLVSTQR